MVASQFLLCSRAKTDSRFSKYPPQPLTHCAGHEPESEIRNVIFDLGGVFYRIDSEKAVAAFLSLAPMDFEVPGTEIFDNRLFHDFESGALSPEAFREKIREQFSLTASDAQIDAAWNSLLVGLEPDWSTQLMPFRNAYKLALLSNTNRIHFDALKDECKDFFSHFDHCFFSFEMGMRKPAQSIYLQVLEQCKFLPAETLFIDDNLQNVEAARETGMKSILFRHWNSLKVP
jgi:glucose-1-phosphatase